MLSGLNCAYLIVRRKKDLENSYIPTKPGVFKERSAVNNLKSTPAFQVRSAKYYKEISIVGYRCSYIEMGFGTMLCPLLLVCVHAVLLKANEIDFLNDLSQNASIGLQRDQNGDMLYCMKNSRTELKGFITASDHFKDDFVRDMAHSSFITTAEVRIKEVRGKAQFVLFSIQRTTDRKKLFTWWLNVAYEQVGVTYINGGRTSILWFSKVPFSTTDWTKLTLRFRKFQKNKGNPIVEFYLNDKKVDEKRLSSGDFKDQIVKAQSNIDISLADILNSKAEKPKICMRKVKVYTDTSIEDVLNTCAKPAVTKEDLVKFEQRITASMTATCDQAMSKIMQQMQSMLNTCGVCKAPLILRKRPPPTGTGRKAVKPVRPVVGIKPKQVLKSLKPVIPCPPGRNPCHVYAQCVPNVLASGKYCKCNVGFAGNGYTCGTDSDLDGFPDEDLPTCKEKNCRKDNCKNKPNSGQENSDGDVYGNACDPDSDNDGIFDKRDNCPLHYNPNQMDHDADDVGDICDNCIKTRNRDQKDTDKDGKGDVCSEDLDSDGAIENDNCPYIKNSNQADSDGDGVGDACDNCPKKFNDLQKDVDADLVGDACDSNIDRDRDGRNDQDDNCVNVINPGQLDTDGDGLGDACDDDDDNDGVLDKVDNCRLTANADQKVDPNSLKYGLACKDDYDGDSIANNIDSCPENRDYSSVSFFDYQTINLDPKEEEQRDPVWKILDQGREILQVENSDPGMAIGKQYFGGVDYYGTIFVDTEVDNDYFGLVFGYQSNSKFYTVMWKKVGQIYWDKEPFEAHGKTGLSIKVVDSITGPGPELRNALWSTASTKKQVRTIWHDPEELGWISKTSYAWELKHRPSTGYIRFRIYDGVKTVIDTGVLNDKTYSGGRIGVMSFSQEKVKWSKIFYQCNAGAVKK